MTTTGVGVLDKVVSILRVFDEGSTVREPSEIARITGLSTPTAYRLLKAMSTHGLLMPRERGYALGPALLRLGHLAGQGMDVVATAKPFMSALREECNETIELQVVVGHSRVPMHMEASSRTVRPAAQVGVPLPLHKGSSARPLVAWLPRDKALDLARRSAAADGDDLDEEAYAERLERIRERGYDMGLGERDPEAGACAAPVFDGSGRVVAGLVASGTLMRFQDDEHRDQIVAGVVRTAAEITAAIGGHPPTS